MNQVPGFTNYYQQQGTSKRNGLSNNPIIPHNTNSANHQLQQVLAQAGHLGGVKIVYLFLICFRISTKVLNFQPMPFILEHCQA